jgi:hypothetical protein
VAGERLTAHYGKDADNRADQRDDATDRDRDMHLRTGEEAWFEHGRVYPVHGDSGSVA